MNPPLPGSGEVQEVPCNPLESSRDACIAMMSHELKQPLTTLLLNLDRLLDKATGQDAQGVLILGEAMRRSIRRQARIIDDLFDLSRVRTGKLRLDVAMVDLDAIVRSIASELAVRAPDRQLHVDMDPTAPHRCMADPVRLEQILSNLLDNALKFTSPGGRIEVQVAGIDGFARVSVTDDGCGISAQFLPHVFRMLGQERRVDSDANPGMGIGLALVEELAKAHGGRVEADSRGAGCGARFTVWLPVLGRASGVRSTTAQRTAALSSRSIQASMEMPPMGLVDRFSA